MRKPVLVATSTLVLALLAAMSPSATAAQDDLFSGTWTSVDLDGSNQQLDIRGPGLGGYSMMLRDDSATSACGGSPARVQGSGDAHQTSLVMTGVLTCLPGGNPLRHRIALGFVYSAETDTLTDDSGVTWYRD